MSGEQDRINMVFLIIVAVFSAIYGIAFVAVVVFHLLQIPVMVALMSVWVLIGFSWMTLDAFIERRRRKGGRFYPWNNMDTALQ